MVGGSCLEKVYLFSSQGGEGEKTSEPRNVLDPSALIMTLSLPFYNLRRRLVSTSLLRSRY